MLLLLFLLFLSFKLFLLSSFLVIFVNTLSVDIYSYIYIYIHTHTHTHAALEVKGRLIGTHIGGRRGYIC